MRQRGGRPSVAIVEAISATEALPALCMLRSGIFANRCAGSGAARPSVAVDWQRADGAAGLAGRRRTLSSVCKASDGAAGLAGAAEKSFNRLQNIRSVLICRYLVIKCRFKSPIELRTACASAKLR